MSCSVSSRVSPAAPTTIGRHEWQRSRPSSRRGIPCRWTPRWRASSPVSSPHCVPVDAVSRSWTRSWPYCSGRADPGRHAGRQVRVHPGCRGDPGLIAGSSSTWDPLPVEAKVARPRTRTCSVACLGYIVGARRCLLRLRSSPQRASEPMGSHAGSTIGSESSAPWSSLDRCCLRTATSKTYSSNHESFMV